MNEVKQRPRGLTATALFMLGLVTKGFGIVRWPVYPNDIFAYEIGLMIILLVASILTIWRYWSGNNWARRLVLSWWAFNVWLLLNWNATNLTRWEVPKLSFALTENTLTENTLVVGFGAFLFYWLNTPEVLSYFHKSSSTHPRSSFLLSIQNILVWMASLTMACIGIFFAGTSIFVQYGISRKWSLLFSVICPLLLAILIVSVYYKYRPNLKTLRRFAYFVAAWILAFGFILITKPSPLLSWFQSYGRTIAADKRLEFYERYKQHDYKQPDEASPEIWKQITSSFATAEKWHLWQIKQAEGFGTASPLLAKSLEDTADFYDARNRVKAADLLYRRALVVWENAFGPKSKFAMEVLRKRKDEGKGDFDWLIEAP